MKFTITHYDPDVSARTGILETDHGSIETPVFMPVGTQGTVKTLTSDELEETGTSVILNNTYHLYLRPGADLIRKAGGTHKFSGWRRPVLTDSGGYQVFSLADLNTISDEGVAFQSHIDGTTHFFTPETIIDIQKKIGADIIMPLDYPAGYPVDKYNAQTANRITLDWLKRSRESFESGPFYHDYGQYLFGIIQGSVFPDLREYAVEETVKMDFPGYAIGGLSVGETKEELFAITEVCTRMLPADKPRYLMGVGKPEDLIKCIESGIDMFDCVLPTRVGRNGWLYTPEGRIIIKNTEHRESFAPVDESCPCYTCRNFTKSYLRHLFLAGEMLGPRLATIHNVTFYHRIIQNARDAIREKRYRSWKKEFFSVYRILNGTINNQFNEEVMEE
ncbi:tRNA guanosine(34) transglycosylase Tgt [candidate division KSB1 bacterium]